MADHTHRSPPTRRAADEAVLIHIQNAPPAPDGLTLDADRLERALRARKGLRGRQFSISVDAGGEQLPADLDAEIIIALAKLDVARARQAVPRLKWVQTTFAGVEGMLEKLPRGFRITNASGVHAEKGGEFILAAALMLAYQIPQFVTDREEKQWRPQFGPVLDKHRITILGVGAIGAAAAQNLRRQGCRVTGVTRSGRARTKLDRIVKSDDLDEVLQQTDILVSTLPDTPQSKNLIDRRRIGLLPDNAGVVVVGRAAALDYDAILDRLDAGTLRGAVLDVFPEEPIPKRGRAWKTPRLIITPHCSVDDHTVYIERCLEIFLDNLERYLSRRKLHNLVDPTRGY
jgi:phosphoglycerate dehydrogenase-like enzyme